MIPLQTLDLGGSFAPVSGRDAATDVGPCWGRWDTCQVLSSRPGLPPSMVPCRGWTPYMDTQGWGKGCPNQQVKVTLPLMTSSEDTPCHSCSVLAVTRES